VRGGIRFGSGIAALVGGLLLGASESAAEWRVYVQGGLGISGAELETDGQAGSAPTTNLIGKDHDSSPLLDAAVGLEVPMDELVPREFLLKVRLPEWPVRLELEAAGLREWEFSTVAGGEDFFTEINATTVLINSWVDMPLVSLYKPIQYLFGLGRQPNVRHWIEPMSLYFGTGIGLTAQMEIDGTSNVVSAQDDIVDFAWNVGTGINYQFNEKVKLAVGYRYLGLGEPVVDTRGPFAPGGNDEVDYKLDVHELRVAVRVLVFEFPSPWR
jgi:hypothetical protein